MLRKLGTILKLLFTLLLFVGGILVVCVFHSPSRQKALQIMEKAENTLGVDLYRAKHLLAISDPSGAVKIDTPSRGSSPLYVHHGKPQEPGNAINEESEKKTAQTPERPASSSNDKTKVRIVGWPTYRWKKGRTVLAGVTLTARNVGSKEARGIRVHVKCPGGDMIQLNGPAQLAPNAKGVYSSERERGVAPGKVKPVVSCSNCYPN
jgi:hypothetical protein